MFDLKDSGERKTFDSGALRECAPGKGRYDLISPIFLDRLAKVMEKGAKKYADHNWEKGMPLSRYMDSALRHLHQYQEGHRDEDHLGQAAFNIMALLHTEEMIGRALLDRKLRDLPSYLGTEPETFVETKTVDGIIDLPPFLEGLERFRNGRLDKYYLGQTPTSVCKIYWPAFRRSYLESYYSEFQSMSDYVREEYANGKVSSEDFEAWRAWWQTIKKPN